ncbi:MAG: outer membrane protein transport protein [Proteobacteria bacterium]|nr:outer membrane protein transport protein [Pseudomonadota bacterium]
MAICTQGISLANTCTADPPGIMAIHYNPAGLSHLRDGKTMIMGVSIPVILINTRLEADPDAEDFMGGWGPNASDPTKRDPLAGTEGTSGPLMYIPIYNDTIPFLFGPTIGLSTREPDSKWTFAVGSYAPFAVGLTHDKDDDPLRFASKSVVQQHLIYAAPSASYKIDDNLSVGLSIGMGQTATIAKMDMRSPSDMIALTRILGEATQGLEIPIISELTLPSPWFGGGVAPYDKVAQISLSLRDDFSPSYNVGLLWEPKNWLSMGLCYQSEVKLQMTGRFSVQHSPQFTAMMNWMSQGVVVPIGATMLNLPTSGEDQYGYCSSTSLNYPQRVQFGVKLQPLAQFKYLFDVHWADWSIIQEDRFVFDQQISVLRLVNIMGYGESPNQMVLQRHFKNTLHWSTAIEYLPTDWLTFRLGYEMRPTSVRAEYYDGLYSLPDLHNIGTGLGIKMDNGIELDLGFAYIFNKSFTVPNNSSLQMNSNEWTRPVYNPFVGLDYFQETKVYIGSVSATMPLEIMVSMASDSMDSIKNIFSKLNPFD